METNRSGARDLTRPKMAKNIVLCSDGTGQDAVKRTNVARLFELLDLEDAGHQIACYDAGVGTRDAEPPSADSRTRPGAVRVAGADPATPVRNRLSQLAGLAVGYGLFRNVQQLYSVLVEHYVPGDRIYLFGFSRGAFTIRVLAGLLHRCGILLPQHQSRYAEAFALYEPHREALPPDKDQKLEADLVRFKRAFAVECEAVNFLGLWDTVKSVGYIVPRSLPHTRRNPLVKTVRHASRSANLVPSSFPQLGAVLTLIPRIPRRPLTDRTSRRSGLQAITPTSGAGTTNRTSASPASPCGG